MYLAFSGMVEVGLDDPENLSHLGHFDGSSEKLNVTGPGKTGLIYTKYTCSYYGKYLLFCICYPKSVSCIEFFMDLCTYDDILDAI